MTELSDLLARVEAATPPPEMADDIEQLCRYARRVSTFLAVTAVMAARHADGVLTVPEGCDL